MTKLNEIRTAISLAAISILGFSPVVNAAPVSLSIDLISGYDVTNGYAPIDLTGTLRVTFDNTMTGSRHTILSPTASYTDSYYNNPATLDLTLNYAVPTLFQSSNVSIAAQFYNYKDYPYSPEQFRLYSFSNDSRSYVSLVINTPLPLTDTDIATPITIDPATNLDLLFAAKAHPEESGRSVDIAQHISVYDTDTGALISQNVLAWKGVITSIDSPTPVPEASTYAMMLAGLALVGVAARRRL